RLPDRADLGPVPPVQAFEELLARLRPVDLHPRPGDRSRPQRPLPEPGRDRPLRAARAAGAAGPVARPGRARSAGRLVLEPNPAEHARPGAGGALVDRKSTRPN